MHRSLRYFRTSFIMASVFLGVAGCASHRITTRPRRSIEITSHPPGAKIEVNGRYVGDAPVTVEIETSPSGRFWRDTIIEAYPADKGYTQIRAFNGAARWAISDAVPPEIDFDTRTEPGAAH